MPGVQGCSVFTKLTGKFYLLFKDECESMVGSIGLSPGQGALVL
jgi:hypothetical protein